MTDRPHRPRSLLRFRHAFVRRSLSAAILTMIPLGLLVAGASPLEAQSDGGPILVFGELRADDWTPIAGTVELVPGLTNHAAADLFERKARGRTPRPVASASSGADGAFELAAPRPGIYWIQAKAPGYATVERNLAFLGTNRKAEPLRLPAAMVRTFHIEDPEGRAVPGALLRVALGRDRAHPSDGVTSAVGLSDARGRVDLELAVGERTAQLDVVADGFVPGANRSISAEALRDDWSTVTLLPGQARRLRVTVDGKPHSGAAILLQGGRLPVAWTGAQGEPGEATVWVPPNATARSPMPMVAEAEGLHLHFGIAHRDDENASSTDSTAEVVPVAAQTQTVRGTLVDTGGRPVARAWVWPTAPFGDIVRSDDQGRFAFPLGADYPTDDHKTQVAVALPGMETNFVTIGQHERIVIERPRAGVAVRVTDVDGEPVGGVRIVASPNFTEASQARRFWNRGEPVTVTDSNGRATLRLTADDVAFRVAARKPGFEHWDDVLPPASTERVAEASQSRALDIVLRRGTVQIGWVVDESDIGIAGATVELHRPAPQPLDLRYAMDARLGDAIVQVSSDAEGRFEVRDVPAQKLRLAVSAPGYAPIDIAGVEVPDIDGELGTIVLTPGLQLEGVVVDEDGIAVPGVLVRVQQQTGRTFDPRAHDEPSLLTDGEGRFAKADLAVGQYSLTIRQEGFRELREQVELPLEEELVLRLVRGITVPVRLTDDVGEPLQYGWLRWYETDPPLENGRFEAVRGNLAAADGTAQIAGLRPGAYSLHVSGHEQSPLDLEMVVEPGGRVRVDHEQVRSDGRSLDIRMTRGTTLRGEVFGPDGEPVTDIRITRNGGANHSMNGHEYVLTGLSPGQLEITFESAGYAPHEATLEIGAVDQTYDVTLERGFTLEGAVIDSDTGEAIAAATVRITAVGEQTWYRQDGNAAVTDATGRFVLEGLTTGQFTATARADGYAEGRISPLDIDGPPQAITFELTTGSRVHGVVTGREDARHELEVGLHFPSGQSFTTRPTYDGSYEFRHVPSGAARISAGDQRAAPYFADVEIPEAGELEHDIELGTNRITGTLLVAGEPFGGARLGALAKGQSLGGANAVSDESGRFVLEGIGDGLHEVVVSRNNMPIARREVEVRGDVDITIAVEFTRLVGRVSSARGEAVSGARVAATTRATSILDVRGGSAMTDANGSFVLEVPADVDGFDLSANASGHPPASTTWSRGEPTEIELILPPSGGALRIQWTGSSPGYGSIIITDAAGNVAHSGFGSSQQQWRIDAVPPGDWRAWVNSGLVVLTQPVRVDADPDAETTVTMTWPVTGRVRLRTNMLTMDWTGRTTLRLLDAAGVEVMYPGADRANRMTTAFAQLFTGQPVDAPIGTWTLERIEGESVTARATFSVEPGRITEIAFDE